MTRTVRRPSPFGRCADLGDFVNAITGPLSVQKSLKGAGIRILSADIFFADVGRPEKGFL